MTEFQSTGACIGLQPCYLDIIMRFIQVDLSYIM